MSTQMAFSPKNDLARFPHVHQHVSLIDVQALLLTWSSLCRKEDSSSEKQNFGKVIAFLLFGKQAEGEGMVAFCASDSGMASFFYKCITSV